MKKVLFLIVLMIAAPSYALDLTIYTEEFPPFNFTIDNKISGVSTEVVRHVMARTDFDITIKSLELSEAFKRVQTEKNGLIYSVSRSKEREALFKWIGILTPTTYSVKALRSSDDIKIDRLEDLKRYRIGTNINDIVENWLLANGFVVTDFTRTSGKHSVVKNYKNLLNKEIDVWPAPDAVAYYIARQQGQSNPDAVMKSVYPLKQLSGGYYIAGGLKTPDRVIAAVRKALESFKQTDRYYKILGHWGVDAMGLKTSEPVGKLIYAFRHITRLTRVGYIANDTLSAHKEAGLYRKEMREDLVEAYATTFKQWRSQFLSLQNKVDAIIVGDVSGIKGWDDTEAQLFAIKATQVPTGYVLDGMSAYTLFGYEGHDLIVNKKIAAAANIKIPNGVLKKAARVID